MKNLIVLDAQVVWIQLLLVMYCIDEELPIYEELWRSLISIPTTYILHVVGEECLIASGKANQGKKET